MLLILAILVVLLVVIGVSLLLKGYTATPDPAAVVPLEKFVNAQNDLSQAKEEELRLKLQLDTLALQLDETNVQLSESKKLEGVISSLRMKEADYQEKVRALERDLTFLSQKADSQAQDAIEAITVLKEETESARREVAVKPAVDPAELETLKTASQGLQAQLQEKAAAVVKLEAEVASAGQKLKIDLDAANAKIAKLAEDNQKIQDESAPPAAKLKEFEALVVQSKQEYDAQLQDANLKIQKLAQDLSERQAAYQKELEQAKSQITRLTGELEASRQQIVEARNVGSGAAVVRPSAGTSATGPAVPGQRQDLETQVQKLQLLNKHLFEKEKILQLELNKSRMRVTGLEKILDDLKAASRT